MDDPVVRGREAKLLLDNPLLKEAFEAVRADLIRQMESVAISDTTTQHELVLSIQLLNATKNRLHRFIRDGMFEEAKRTESTRRRKVANAGK